MADLDARWLTEAIDRLNSTLQTIEPALTALVEQMPTQPVPGRCGHASPQIHPAMSREYCALQAGHTGWHRADSGGEWSDPNPQVMRAEIDRLAKDRDEAIREARLSREATDKAVSKLAQLDAALTSLAEVRKLVEYSQSQGARAVTNTSLLIALGGE